VKIHAWPATQPQFWRHLRPIWEALPEELRGTVSFKKSPGLRDTSPDDVWLVAGYGCIRPLGNRRIIYVEHGAGQSYTSMRDRHRGHYSGGPHPDNVIGYVCPSETVAARWDKPTVVVGCPALDSVQADPRRAVVITFHFDCWQVCPETRSARFHYLDHLHEIVQWIRDDRKQPLGHWHPRDGRASGIWRQLRIESEPDPDRALGRADLVIADNSSFQYEAAALGIPNVALNAPWYRRDVEHGMRFWSHPPGVMVDDADELMSRSAEWYITSARNRKIGEAAADFAYDRGVSGGAKLAVESILQWVG
jgi:hypothetical protein